MSNKKIRISAYLELEEQEILDNFDKVAKLLRLSRNAALIEAMKLYANAGAKAEEVMLEARKAVQLEMENNAHTSVLKNL